MPCILQGLHEYDLLILLTVSLSLQDSIFVKEIKLRIEYLHILYFSVFLTGHVIIKPIFSSLSQNKEIDKKKKKQTNK